VFAIECLLITNICLNKSLPKDPCCHVRCDFRIKTMFRSSLPPVVYRRAHVLFTLCVFVYNLMNLICIQNVQSHPKPNKMQEKPICFILLSKKSLKKHINPYYHKYHAYILGAMAIFNRNLLSKNKNNTGTNG
jgi:hypothetical protein